MVPTPPERPNLPPEMHEIAQNWATIPDAVKTGVMAMVRAATR